MYLLLRIVLWSYLTWFSTGDLAEMEWAELLPGMTALCPSVDVCGKTDVNVNDNANSSMEANTCCLGCSCDSNCRARDGTDNCCFQDNDTDHRERTSACLKPSISQGLKLPVYKFITKPPINGCKELDGTVKSTCSSDVEVAPWGNFLPVYSKSLNMNFKNEPCALCHGVEVPDFEPWTTSIPYLKAYPRSFVSVMTQFYETFDSGDVDVTILFDPPSDESVEGKRCYEMIDECPSRWADVFLIPSDVGLDRPAIIRACKDGPRAMYAKNVTHAYKNVFCAMCDYFAMHFADALKCTLDDGRRTSSQLFAGLVDISFLNAFKSAPNNNDDTGLCFRQMNALNDSNCVVPSCPALQVRLPKGDCAYPAKRMKAGCFRVTIQLSSPHTTNESDISEMAPSEVLAMFEELTPWPEMWETSLITMLTSNGTDFLVTLVFQAKQSFSFQNLIKNIKRRLSKQWSLRLTEEVDFTQDFHSVSGNDQLTLYRSRSMDLRCLIIDRMFYCQQIELHPSKYNLGWESRELRLLHSGKILHMTDYTMTVGEDGSERVRVCLEDSGYVKVDATSSSGHVGYGTSGLRELLMAVMAFVFTQRL